MSKNHAPRPHMARFEHKNQLTLTFGFLQSCRSLEPPATSPSPYITVTIMPIVIMLLSMHHDVPLASVILISFITIWHVHENVSSCRTLVTHGKNKNRGANTCKASEMSFWAAKGPFLSNLPFISSQLGQKSPGPRIIAKEMATGALQQWSDDLASWPLQKEGAKWGLRAGSYRSSRHLECEMIKLHKDFMIQYDKWWSWWTICKHA